MGTNELTTTFTVEGRSTIMSIIFNNMKAAKDTIPPGGRKSYTPHWTSELQTACDELSKAREQDVTNPSQESNINLQEKISKFIRTKLKQKRRN